MSLASSYNPKEYEDTLYAEWMQAGVGSPEIQEKHQQLDETGNPTYTILMPPPNLTGNLHAGHAFQHYLMDTLSRIARQNGHTTLWYPGVDHAGIQLEGVIDKLIKKGEFDQKISSIIPPEIEKNNWPSWLKEHARETWLHCAWEKVDEWRNNQKNQSAILGDTPDYDRSLFTLDDRASRMVMYAFQKYWEDGLIYKGEYMVNWSVGLQTALSDFQQDVEWVEQKDPFITFVYVFKEFRFPDESFHQRFSQLISSLKKPEELPELKLSTVRPETKFTDLAVAMHPEKFATYFRPELYFDGEYDIQAATEFIELVRQHKIEVYYHLPPLESQPVKLVLSERVDLNFGTGILKITPGHDPFDYELYNEMVAEGLLAPGQVQTAINRDGLLNADFTGEFAGLTVLQGRMAVIKRLLETGYIPVKEGEDEILPEIYLSDEEFLQLSYQQQIEKLRSMYPNHEVNWDYSHNVLYCERSKTPVEPLISSEYFLSYHNQSREVGKTLQEIGLEGVAQTTFFPEDLRGRAENILENIHDWCISRNLVWGHQIPVWYNLNTNPTKQFIGPDEMNKTFTVTLHDSVIEVLGQEMMQVGDKKPQLNGEWVREEKVFDTWFSSCLWPLTTLNFYDTAVLGKEHTDFEKYYQTQVLVTGVDIFYAWIVRMILLCTYWTGKTPFKHLVVTPTLLDEKGRKMSKSLGNGLQPEDAIRTFSSDALRLALLSGMIPARNMRMGGALTDKLCERYRNFGNKMWNVARFLESKE